jgi:hypothetical protein
MENAFYRKHLAPGAPGINVRNSLGEMTFYKD